MCTESDGDRPIASSYWVAPGRLAAGEFPGAPHSSDARVKLRQLLQAGIDHFIDLTTPQDRLEPYAAIAKDEAAGLGLAVEWERHPIVDGSVPRSTDQMAGVLDAIDDALDQSKTVYVHCWGGVGRTGTVVGCWLVRHGSKGNDALRQIAEWWRRMPELKRFFHPDSPETWEQQEYVRTWSEAPRRESR